MSQCFTTGLLSGCLHALSGPDHVAALLPFIFQQRWYTSCTLGIIWGTGHMLSALVMSAILYLIREFALAALTPELNSFCSALSDSMIAVSFILVGIIGYREAISEDIADVDKAPSQPVLVNITAETSQCPGCCRVSKDKIKVVAISGVALGFSWDGLPSLTPVVGLESLDNMICFIFAYWLGTVIAMGTICAVVSEVSILAGKSISNRFPSKLSFGSSIVALGVGFLLLSQVLFQYLMLHKKHIDNYRDDLETKLMSVPFLYFGLAIIVSAVLIVGIPLLVGCDIGYFNIDSIFSRTSVGFARFQFALRSRTSILSSASMKHQAHIV